MTVKMMEVIQNFIGLSTDPKPTSCPIGSTFYEYNTRSHYITYDGGTNWIIHGRVVKEVRVTKTLIKGSEPISVNLFSFTGPFRLRKLWAVCIEATNVSDIDDCFFNLFDGSNVVDLTDDQSGNGVNLDGITLGSVIGLNATATVDMFYQKSDQCRWLEAEYSGSELWQRGIVTARNGYTNYLRFTYDSDSNSALDIDFEFHLIYADICSEVPSTLVAV